MKKTITMMTAVIAALMMISCQMTADDPQTTYVPDTENTPASETPEENPPADDREPETPDTTPPEKDEDETSEEKVLDLSVTRQYTMNVGETVTLPNFIGDYEVYYQVQNDSDVISVSGTGLTADSVGSAVLKAFDWNDENRTWSCTVTVKAEGFSGSAIEYKLGGNWTREGGSSLVLNQNHTGTMKNYLNESLVQDWVFSWTGSEYGNTKYLNITACYDNKTNKSVDDRQFTVERISSTSLTLRGNLGFGMPATTTWSKE